MDSRPPIVTRQQSIPYKSHVTQQNRRNAEYRHSRRHSVDTNSVNIHHDQQKSMKRATSSLTLTDLNQISWSEYTARRSLVKFRNRRKASQKPHNNTSDVPPSHMARRVLCNQYEVCRREETNLSERIMAVFYCWFFGWIMDVYNTLTRQDIQRSFVKWLLSCVLVTLAVTTFIGLIAVVVHAILIVSVSLLHSVNAFITFITVLFILGLGITTILSYSCNSSQFVTSEHSMTLNERKSYKNICP